MERRYDLLSEVGVRDIGGYNAAFDRGELARASSAPTSATGGAYERLPFILVVVDELNDLMMVAARDVEDSICRIAQMARAVGIHLVIATQRPSVNVITGVIKANIPARLAFAVSSLADSRVILDQPGAERLVGQGDMLLLGADLVSVPQRIQGAWVTEDEVRGSSAHWRRQSPDVALRRGRRGRRRAAARGGDAGGERRRRRRRRCWSQAMELVVRSQLGSTSMLQRKLRVGFARAGRLMDLLEQRGVVGPSEGSKARAVLMSRDELDEIHGQRPIVATDRLGPGRPVAWPGSPVGRWRVPRSGSRPSAAPRTRSTPTSWPARSLADGLSRGRRPDDADLVVVNTCAFVEEARQESIDTILALDDRRARAPSWWSPAAWPSATATSWPRPCPRSTWSPPFGVPVTHRAARARRADGARRFDLLEPAPPAGHARPWAYVKVAEGCDRACGFCAIPCFRGPQRSRTRRRRSWPRSTRSAPGRSCSSPRTWPRYGRDQGRGERAHRAAGRGGGRPGRPGPPALPLSVRPRPTA